MIFKEFFYNRYLGDNKDIEPEIINILTQENTKVALDAPTGSGKTTLIMSIISKLEGIQKYLKDYPSDFKDLKFKMKVMNNRFLELYKIAYQQISFTDKNSLDNLTDVQKHEYEFLSEKIKYYKLVNSGKINLDEINKFRFIFIVPTRILSGQVSKKNNTSELTGNMIIKESDSIVTATYDNINKAISTTKKNILIIDEAHKLITDNNYRYKALDSVRKAEKECFSVMHVTATTRPLINFYKYQYFLKMAPIDPTKNNNVKIFSLIDMPSYNRVEHLISFIEKIFDKNKKLVIRINSKSIIKDVVDTLTSKNIKFNTDYKIGIACNHETMNKMNLKHLDVTNHIQFKEKIPDNFNIVLTTSVLDVGATINNTDMTLIYFAKDKNDMKQEDIKQFFARARLLNEEAFLLTSNSSDITIKPIEQIENEVDADILKVINGFELAKEGLKIIFKDNIEGLSSIVNSMLNTKDYKGNFIHQGCINFNEKNLILEVSPENKRLKILNLFDSQLYYNIEKLKNYLEKDLKANHIEIKKMYYDDSNIKIDNELRDVRKNNADIKKKQSNLASEVIFIYKEINIIRYLYKINNNKNDKEKIQKLKEKIEIEDITLLKKVTLLETFGPLNKAFDSCTRIGLSEDDTIKIIIKNGYKDIDYQILKIQCIAMNKSSELVKWDNNVTQTYFIIRKHSKIAAKNRTGLSKKHQLWMYQELLANKLVKPLKIKKFLEYNEDFKQFEQKNISKHYDIYLEYLYQQYPKHKPKLPIKVIDMFSKEIVKILSLVYHLDSEHRLSNLNK